MTYRQKTLAAVIAANGWQNKATDGLGPPVHAATHSTIAADSATMNRSGRRNVDVSTERCITDTWPAQPDSPGRAAIGDGTASGVPSVHYLIGNCVPRRGRTQFWSPSMNTLLGFPQTDAFGRLLRQWRTTRHLSQLALATQAGISTRHLSFLETGRAQPSREMVQLLAGMLDVPLGERNALLVSAGYAPLYGERPLGAPELEPVRRALQFILRQQEPFPAFVLDAQWNIVMRNDASRRICGLFRGPGHDERSVNVMRTVFDPGRLRGFISNWEDVAQCLMHSLHR